MACPVPGLGRRRGPQAGNGWAHSGQPFFCSARQRRVAAYGPLLPAVAAGRCVARARYRPGAPINPPRSMWPTSAPTPPLPPRWVAVNEVRIMSSLEPHPHIVDCKASPGLGLRERESVGVRVGGESRAGAERECVCACFFFGGGGVSYEDDDPLVRTCTYGRSARSCAEALPSWPCCPRCPHPALPCRRGSWMGSSWAL